MNIDGVAHAHASYDRKRQRVEAAHAEKEHQKAEQIQRALRQVRAKKAKAEKAEKAALDSAKLREQILHGEIRRGRSNPRQSKRSSGESSSIWGSVRKRFGWTFKNGGSHHNWIFSKSGDSDVQFSSEEAVADYYEKVRGAQNTSQVLLSRVASG